MRFIDLLISRLIDTVLVISGLSLAFAMLSQIVMRHAFDGGFSGIEELAVLFGVWFYFMGIARVTRMDAHVKGGIADLLIKNPKGARAVAWLTLIFSVAANALFAWFSVAYLISMIQSGRSSTYLGWPTAIWVAAMALGFLLSTLEAVLKIFRGPAQIRP